MYKVLILALSEAATKAWTPRKRQLLQEAASAIGDAATEAADAKRQWTLALDRETVALEQLELTTQKLAQYTIDYHNLRGAMRDICTDAASALGDIEVVK